MSSFGTFWSKKERWHRIEVFYTRTIPADAEQDDPTIPPKLTWWIDGEQTEEPPTEVYIPDSIWKNLI